GAGRGADMPPPAIRTAVGNALATPREPGWPLSPPAALLAGMEAPERETADGVPDVPVEAFREIADGLPVYPPRGSPPQIPLLDLDADSDDEIRARLGIGPSMPRSGNDAPFVCFAPFRAMYVRSKAHVKSGCHTADAAPALGTLPSRSGEAVWNGRGFAAMRAAFTGGAYPKKACGNCLANGQAPASHGVGQML